MPTTNKDFVVKNGLIVQSSNSSSITTSAASSIGLIIKGSASQSANLQEWQNDAGTILSRMDAFGRLSLRTTNIGGAILSIIPDATTSPGIIVRGLASQTADLQQWQNSAGTVLNRVFSDGTWGMQKIYTSTGLANGSSQNNAEVQVLTTGTQIFDNTTTNVALTVKHSNASSTVDLQRWVSSANATLASINNLGHLSTSKINFTGGTTTISAQTLADGTVSFEGTAGQLFSISNSLTGTIFAINDISGLPSVEVTDLGIIKLNELYGQTVVGSGTPIASTQMSIISRTAATTTLVLRGASGQSALLQEWQGSDGFLRSYVDGAGRMGVRWSDAGITSSLAVSNFGSASTVPITVRGAASQTANLQEWQNSAGTVVMAVTSGGNLDMTRTSPRVTLTDGGSTSIQLGANSGTTFIGNTTNHPLYFITNNLERMRIDASGNIGIGTATPWSRTSIFASNDVSSGGSTTSQYPVAIHRGSGANGDQTGIAFSIYVDASSPATYTPGAAITHERTGLNSVGDLVFKTRPTSGNTDAVVERMRITSTGLVGIGESPSGAMLDIANNTAANVGLIVKAATSQSANLQDWQSSAGSTLAYVRNDGVFFGNQGILSTAWISSGSYISNAQMISNTGNPAFIGLLVRGATSQTANLQEWQNSGGTVLTSVSPTGYITLPGAPTVDNHAATKAYVDSVAQGLDIKASVHAATTTAGTLATSFANGQIIDGVTLVTGDRILIKNQATASENGIYTVNASGAPTRAADMNAGDEFPGAFTFVEEGTVNADTGWVCTNNTPITIGTTSITFSQFSGAGTYTAGDGLSLTGPQFAVDSTVVRTSGNQTIAGDKTFTGNINISGILDLTNTGVVNALDMSNNSIVGVNLLTFADPGPGEGLVWASGNFSLFESPNDLTTNSSGNLQFVTGTAGSYARRMTINTSGQVEIPVATGTAPLVISSTTAVTNLNADLLDGQHGSYYAPLASPALTGTPTAPTAASSVSNTQIATTAYVKSLFTTAGTGGTLDWNDVSNTRPGVGPTLLLGSATNGPGGGTYYHPLNIEYSSTDGTGNVTQLAIAYGSPGNQILMRGRYSGTWSSWVSFATLAGGTYTGQIQSTLANSTTTGGGQIYLNGATGNRIDFNQNGIAAPSFTTRSVGTKIVLYPNLSGSAADYALGIDTATMWFSVTNTSTSFKWYGGTTLAATLTGAGAFSAVTKSFDIEHPTKEGMRLRYGSLEGPENGVYVRGKSKEKTIELPDYWTGLVDKDTITVNLTAIGSGTLYVKEIVDNTVLVGGTAKEFFFTVFGERKDVDKLTVEY